MASEVEVVSEETGSVWNVASNLCSACLDGHYENCYCDDEERLEKDLHDSSEEQEGEDGGGEGEEEEGEGSDDARTSAQKRNSIYDVYISDDEFHENEEEDEQIELPPPTTDWDSIDSVLEKELEPGEEVDVELSKRLSHNVNISMVFVDSEESDKASDPDVEAYYDDEDGRKNNGSTDDLRVDSRDSGYLTTDVTDAADSKRRSSSSEPTEDSSRVLTSLKLHQDYEDKLNGETDAKEEPETKFIDEVHQKNVDELRTMKEFLELHIAKINYELLEQLEIRDYLHTKNETLQMDADDIAKSAEAEGCDPKGKVDDIAPTNPTTKPHSEANPNHTESEPPDPEKSPADPANPLGPSRSRAPKRKSFWWR